MEEGEEAGCSPQGFSLRAFFFGLSAGWPDRGDLAEGGATMRKWLALVFLFILPVAAYGEARVELAEIVVTATRVPTPAEEVGSSTTVISEEEIKAKGYTTVAEVLKGVLGLDVVSTGGPGALTTVFLRGMESYHTLVMIDGLRVGDPSLMQRQFNFANLTVDGVERIEVVRGPQSVLYGADAIGGVVNIITKRGKGKPSFYAGSEGGSYDTFRQFAGGSGEVGKMAFSFGVSHTRTSGFSAADDDLPGNEEADGWENFTLTGRLDLEVAPSFTFGSTFRFQQGDTELDLGGGPYRDVEDYHVEHDQFFVRPYVEVSLLGGRWRQRMAFGLTRHKRKYLENPWGDSTYEGKSQQFLWQHELELHRTNWLLLGLEYQQEEMESVSPWSAMEESAYTFSLFAEDQITLAGVSYTTLGLRWDHHEEFGDHTTFRLTQSFLIRPTGTKLCGSVGTGFRAPSLYELYGPPFWGRPVGNPDLDPEKSLGWDVGIEQKLFGGLLKAGVTYFRNEVDDLIEYISGRGYVNMEEAESWGIEAFLEAGPWRGLSGGIMYTYTETEDEEGRRLLRRPLNKIGVSLSYRFLQERGRVGIRILWVDDRDDLDWSVWPARRVELNEYTRVDLSGSFKVHRNLEVFARVENLFDEDYQEAYGYGTPGFSAYGGVKVVF